MATPELHYGVFDLETQLAAADVGGWHRAELMKISCAVLYDSKMGICSISTRPKKNTHSG